MKRRLAREIALQTLFQMEFSDIEMEAALLAVCAEHELNESISLKYVESLVNGVLDNKASIDERIIKQTSNWKLDRISAVDRNILRIAIYELMHSTDKLSPNIIINEALEVAKIYGTDNSTKFVNGILGKMSNDKE